MLDEKRGIYTFRCTIFHMMSSQLFGNTSRQHQDRIRK